MTFQTKTIPPLIVLSFRTTTYSTGIIKFILKSNDTDTHKLSKNDASEAFEHSSDIFRFFLACILILLVNSVAHPKLRLHVIPLSLQDIPVRLGSLEVPVKTKYVTEFAL